jgi:hypothetical protein
MSAHSTTSSDALLYSFAGTPEVGGLVDDYVVFNPIEKSSINTSIQNTFTQAILSQRTPSPHRMIETSQENTNPRILAVPTNTYAESREAYIQHIISSGTSWSSDF